MTQTRDPSPHAEYIDFDEFRHGLPSGRFHVIVNPELARSFVAQSLHATPVAIAIVGVGIASAVGGHAVAGAVLVTIGVLLRRAVRWRAAHILLHLASRQRETYKAATANGVMEVQRR